MDLNKRIRSAIVWSIMACLCGLIGFVIVRYYATNVRPIERFAIVIDAGSTQTRSNLFRLTIETDNLSGTLADNDLEGEVPALKQTPIRHLLNVQQIGSCINGGPLASMTNQLDANNLVQKCLIKFASQIRLLNFVDTLDGDGGSTNKLDASSDKPPTVADHDATSSLNDDGIGNQLALINHRVNSITHLHLGATAGMRALEQLNATRAKVKLDWIERSIKDSNQMLADNYVGPYINSGYVGILSGADEASFGWVSVNFVCNTLVATVPQSLPDLESLISGNKSNHALIYQLDDDSPTGHRHIAQLVRSNNNPDETASPSIGTLELGGASAQMAFQVMNSVDNFQIRNINLEEQSLTLFNGHYKLATRSDLCLGMSQAVLRLNYVLLHQTIVSTLQNKSEPEIVVANVCLQKGSTIKLTGSALHKLWQGACLLPNDKLGTDSLDQASMIRAIATSRKSIKFLGTGEVDRCNVLLSELLNPNLCKKYFALCPENKITSPPPKDMPFVTISGYNHALRVLDLEPATPAPKSAFEEESGWTKLNQAVEDELGGRSIDYEHFVQQTRQYCSTDVNELAQHYPKVTKQYENIICLQLVYIRLLLVEFYQLNPQTSWQQIKFLLFEPKTTPPGQYTKLPESDKKDTASRPDIGWTLGLLLNATSYQLDSGAHHYIYHHHGVSPMYVARATILLVVACSLIAVAFLVISVVQVKETSDSLDSPPSQSSRSSSTYNIGNLGYTLTYPSNYNSINSMADLQHQNKSAT